MQSKFRHVALIGKYQAVSSGDLGAASRAAMQSIAQFLHAQGCEVVFERQTAANMGIPGYDALDVAAIGAQCDLGLVVGGDGTMLGIGRQLAPHGVPLIGINQGRLGFITDIPLDGFEATLAPMLRGEYEEDHRSLMHARVMRDGRCVLDALAMNDVVVNRGATSGMVELRVEVDGRFLANRPIVLADAAQISIELVSGRDASANFDMQSIASLLHGDRIVVSRSEHQVRFLHPRGWSYFDTLRQKLHWNEGAV